MARLEGAYEQVSQRLMNVDPRFDGVDRRFDGVDRRFDGVDRKIDLLRDALDKKIDALEAKIDAKIDQRFMWTIGVVITTWLTSIGTTVASVYLRH